MAQPIQPVDRLCSFGRRPVEGGQKVSLCPSGLLFPIKVEPQPVEVRSRSDWGPTVTFQALNANGESTSRPLTRPVEPQTASLAFLFYKKALIFIVSRA